MWAVIEHTSANPIGPFHVGRARNAILGDTLVRLNRVYGNKVRAEYYLRASGPWPWRHSQASATPNVALPKEPKKKPKGSKKRCQDAFQTIKNSTHLAAISATIQPFNDPII